MHCLCDCSARSNKKSIFVKTLKIEIMGKYSRDLDEKYVKKIKEMVAATGLRECGVTIEPICLNSKKSYGEIIKSNEFVQLFTGDKDMVGLAVNEQLFDTLDEQTITVLIDSLLSQISYDGEKDKVVITKPEISVGIGMLHKYKEVAVQKIEAAYYGLQQIEQKKKEEKEMRKSLRTKKNKQ